MIEISNTSLADDLGVKRLLYEDLRVAEYWIIDIQNTQIFTIVNGGSRRITESQVLTGLKLNILREALQQSRSVNHSEVGKWLMGQFQKK